MLKSARPVASSALHRTVIASTVPSGPGTPRSSIPDWRSSRASPLPGWTARWTTVEKQKRSGGSSLAYRVTTSRAIGPVMSARRESSSPLSPITRYGAAIRPSSAVSGYSSSGVETSPYPASEKVWRRAPSILRRSAISSGSTSRVPLGRRNFTTPAAGRRPALSRYVRQGRAAARLSARSRGRSG